MILLHYNIIISQYIIILMTVEKNARGGGVAIYKDINCSQVEGKSLTVTDILESITVEMTYIKTKHIIVCCIYRKPATNIDTLCERIEHIFGTL